MRKSISLLTFSFLFIASANILSAQQSERQRFNKIEEADLHVRFDTARQLARSKNKRRYWTGYSFDLRRGVGVDINIPGFLGATGVVTGVSPQFETRNVGLFMLYDSATGNLVRAELYNLDRRNDFGGYAIYWLGRVSGEESLSMLEKLIGTTPEAKVAASLTQAVALHDRDTEVVRILKSLVRTSVEEVRMKAVAWLGRIPGQIPFLADVARHDSQSIQVRKRAVMSIGKSDDDGALKTLQGLYRVVKERKVKERIIDAALKTHDREGAIRFLNTIAKSDKDNQLRERALRKLRTRKAVRT